MNPMIMLPVTYGYARVSKSDDDAKNLDTQLRLLANHGIREDLIFTDVASGRTMNRPGWRDGMADEAAGLRQIARVMQCSPATVKKTLVGCQPQSGAPRHQEPLVG